MANKRKRPSKAAGPAKRAKSQNTDERRVGHPVLKHYYQNVLTLRDYVTSRLATSANGLGTKIREIKSHHLNDVGHLLDSVIVGVNENAYSVRQCRAQDLAAFSQQLPCSTLGSNADPGVALQLEVIDFVIWLQFRRRPPPYKPQHLLCHGFERASAAGQNGQRLSIVPGIPGIVCQYPNPHIETVTGKPWCKLLSLLGRGGDLIMVDLLLDCGLFVPAMDGIHGFRQLSGKKETLPATKSIGVIDLSQGRLSQQCQLSNPRRKFTTPDLSQW
jgi:hypothetical protein